MPELLELAARCEAAEGADRALDAGIALAIGWQNCIPCDFNGIKHRMGGILNAPTYTASLDAAMMLVPEGWNIGQLNQHWRSTTTKIRLDDCYATKCEHSCALTPALALCAAALRARAA